MKFVKNAVSHCHLQKSISKVCSLGYSFLGTRYTCALPEHPLRKKLSGAFVTCKQFPSSSSLTVFVATSQQYKVLEVSLIGATAIVVPYFFEVQMKNPLIATLGSLLFGIIIVVFIVCCRHWQLYQSLECLLTESNWLSSCQIAKHNMHQDYARDILMFCVSSLFQVCQISIFSIHFI